MLQESKSEYPLKHWTVFPHNLSQKVKTDELENVELVTQ